MVNNSFDFDKIVFYQSPKPGHSYMAKFIWQLKCGNCHLCPVNSIIQFIREEVMYTRFVP